MTKDIPLANIVAIILIGICIIGIIVISISVLTSYDFTPVYEAVCNNHNGEVCTNNLDGGEPCCVLINGTEINISDHFMADGI